MPYTVQGAKDAIQALIDEQKNTGKKVITEESLRNIIKDFARSQRPPLGMHIKA